MIIKKYFNPQISIILFFTFITRIIFTEKYFFDADSIGFALGTISYSLIDTRPHLPGYILHVKLISLLNNVFNDVHFTMIVINIAYSIVGAVLAYVLLRKIFSDKKAFITIILIITNPLVWYYNCTTDIYSFDLFFAALAVLIGLNKKTVYFLPIIFSVGMGIRPTSGIILSPLYVYFWYRLVRLKGLNKYLFFFTHLTGFVIFYTWFSVLTTSAGGLNNYLTLYSINSPLPHISLLQNFFQETSYFFYVFVPTGIIILTALSRKSIVNIFRIDGIKEHLILLLIWILPALFVFLFFNYSKGYFLICIIPLFTLILLIIHEDSFIIKSLWAVAILQIAFFVLMPCRDTAIESIATPKNRIQNILLTWVDRTFTSYLMSASKIRSQDEYILELNSEIKQFAVDSTKYIFIDPTLYQYARAMQMQDFNRTYITADFYNDNKYFKYKGINICAGKDLTGVFQNAYVITRKDFYNSYLNNFTAGINEKSLTVIFNTNAVNSRKILNIYRNLFLRTNH